MVAPIGKECRRPGGSISAAMCVARRDAPIWSASPVSALWEAAISACEPEVMPAISRHAEMARYLRPVTLNPRSQGLVLAVAGTGRLTSDGALQLGGGGDLNVRIGGEVNPSREARATDLPRVRGLTVFTAAAPFTICRGPHQSARGSASLYSGALGGIDPRYDTLLRDPAEVRSRDAFSPTLASSTGGLTLVAGDTGMRLETRGDLVLGGVTDPGRGGVPNTVGFTAPDGSVYQGVGSVGSVSGLHTIDLFAAGGNLTPSNGRGNQRYSHGRPKPVACDGRFIYPSIVRAAAPEGSIYLGPSSGYMGGVSLNVSTTPYSLLLAPSLNGELELLAGDSIYAGGYSVQRSGADPANLPSIWTPAFAATPMPRCSTR